MHPQLVGWLVPNLTAAWRSLGLTPDSGTKAGWTKPHKPDALDELRDAHRRTWAVPEEQAE